VFRFVLAALAVALGASGGAQERARPAPLALGGALGPTRIELAGKPISLYPHFQFTRSFNAGEPIRIAFDPRVQRSLARRTVDVFLIRHAELERHLAGEKLTGNPLRVTIAGPSLKDNVFLFDAGTLEAAAKVDDQGTFLLGRGYDLAVDVDRDGALGAGDFVDGSLEEAGFTVVEDFVDFRDEQARTTGPYDVNEVLYNGGGPNQRMAVYFPTAIATLGELPLLVVSHGNGHQYTWYDHVGFHMASWGYVVMSHQNNTGPGIETASTTTLSNTELFLARLEEIAGGALAGHVDSHRIAWMGHSRGGEGVVRAYRRLELGTPLATRYTLSDIKLVSSIAPTDFLGPNSSNMGAAPYHLWTGGADADVNGCANCDICQTFHLLERADGTRFSISLHGAGHGDFHDDPSSSVAAGPCRIGRATTHAIMRAHLLPLVQYVLHDNRACLDYLTRQWEEFHATSAPDSLPGGCVSVDLMYVPGPERERYAIDDFQSNPLRGVSSSGGRVLRSPALDVTLAEGRLDDATQDFSDLPSDAMNGMTLASRNDSASGLVFEWSANETVTFEVLPEARDFRAWRTLSFRAAQATRDARTTAELGDLDFSVRLIDANTRASTIRIGAYGGGIEEPYQRTTCGLGAGWANEFETIRVPLADFVRDGHVLDLSNVIAVELAFGSTYGSAFGRIGLDDLLLSRD
jgi:hypothetical protein